MFFILFAMGCGEVANEIGTQLAYVAFHRNSSKIEVFETYFFEIVTTQYDHPRCVKHVLDRIYVFFTLFGYWVQGGAGVSPGIGTPPADAVFHPGQLKNRSFSPWTAQKRKFSKLIFSIV